MKSIRADNDSPQLVQPIDGKLRDANGPTPSVDRDQELKTPPGPEPGGGGCDGGAGRGGSAGEIDDPFDLNRLRLSQDFAQSLSVKKVLVTVPVRKPDKQWFIRVHPDPAYRLSTAILELKEERESYLVEPDMWPELTSEITPKTLFTAVNRQGLPFLLPVRLPGPDGRLDPWNQSLLEGVEIGMKKWVRIAPKMALGAYELSVATNNLPEPVWPDTTFRDLVAVAFKGRIIQTPDHPVLRRLRGEV